MIKDKIDQIDRQINCDEARQARLLEMENTYNRAIKKGLIDKPQYDILDVLQMEVWFFTEKL